MRTGHFAQQRKPNTGRFDHCAKNQNLTEMFRALTLQTAVFPSGPREALNHCLWDYCVTIRPEPTGTFCGLALPNTGRALEPVSETPAIVKDD